jgi:hypothetical protein
VVVKKKNEEKYVEKIIKEANKISKGNKELYDEYLISHNVCPVCKKISIVHDENDTYCSICGTVYDDVVYYQSHGSEFDENRNRKEIYTPPSTLRNKATPFYNIEVRTSKLNTATKYKFYKLRKINFLVGASFAKNSQIVKRIEELINVAIASKDENLKNLIIESVLMMYSKIQKRFRSWKKINIVSIFYIVAQQLGIKIDLSKIYNFEGNNKISLNKFKRNIKRGVEKIFAMLTEQERVELKKFMLNEIVKESRQKNIDKKTLDLIFKTVNDIYEVYPNITFYDAVKTILARVYRHKAYKSYPEGVAEKINQIIDKKFKIKQ